MPGEVAGYWAAKQRFGNPALAWAELVQPAIEMCNNGGWSQAGHEYSSVSIRRILQESKCLHTLPVL